MIKTIQNRDIWRFEETPSRRRKLAAVVALLGFPAAVAGFAGGSFAVAAIGVLIVAAGAALIYREPLTRLVLDRAAGRLAICRRRLMTFERRNLDFDQIRYFRLVVHREGRETIGLVLDGGETLTVFESSRNVEEFECRYLLRINELFRKSRFR
ncbi:MAG: hypothetical protein JSS81_19235 [Acidobacteria bacterium]|nr:hypothetical protein [Acidobacteriota bacterium]